VIDHIPAESLAVLKSWGSPATRAKIAIL